MREAVPVEVCVRGPWAGSKALARTAMSCLSSAAILLTLGGTGAQARTVLDAPIVLTQVPEQAKVMASAWDTKGLVRADWFEGSRIVVVSSEGQVRVLSEGFASACDPNVSFDARHVVFAGKRDPQSRWRIWEIGIDGQDLRPISPENQDARNPIYLSRLFTLDSPEPWFTIVYVGKDSIINETGCASASSLYNIKLDGTELRRLTFNPNHNFDPFQMWDGRVIYAGEHYPVEPNGGVGRVGLYGIHMVGTDGELYGGEAGRRIQHMPCATDQGLVLFVENDELAWDGAGQLSCLDERRPHYGYKRLTDDASFLYLYPAPWRTNVALVSRRPANGQGTSGVFCFDLIKRECTPVFDSREYHDLQAQVVKPRPRPDGHSTIVEPAKYNTGIFYGMNCYDADERMSPYLSKGTFQRLRVIEGVPNTAEKPLPDTPCGDGSKGRLIPRRLIGEAPIEADGSFNVEVPADTPVLLQALDERGLALATCGWLWVKQREARACVGCHEDPELTPENQYVLALRRPSNRLTLPPGARRSVAFRETVAPILKAHCATTDCHGGQAEPLHLDLRADRPTAQELARTYTALLAPREVATNSPPVSAPGKYVDPGRARTSFLIWQLFGRDTSRPWDRDPVGAPAGNRKVKQMPPPGKGDPLAEEEIGALVQWVDLGAQYEGVNTAYPPTITRPAQTPQ
jgi:hypothetical protein